MAIRKAGPIAFFFMEEALEIIKKRKNSGLIYEILPHLAKMATKFPSKQPKTLRLFDQAVEIVIEFNKEDWRIGGPFLIKLAEVAIQFDSKKVEVILDQLQPTYERVYLDEEVPRILRKIAKQDLEQAIALIDKANSTNTHSKCWREICSVVAEIEGPKRSLAFLNMITKDGDWQQAIEQSVSAGLVQQLSAKDWKDIINDILREAAHRGTKRTLRALATLAPAIWQIGGVDAVRAASDGLFSYLKFFPASPDIAANNTLEALLKAGGQYERTIQSKQEEVIQELKAEGAKLLKQWELFE